MLVVAVALLHALATRELAERMAALDPAQAMPARIEVVYVRALEPEAPVAAAVAVAVAAPTPRRARAPRAAAAPASAVEVASSAPEADPVVAAVPEAAPAAPDPIVGAAPEAAAPGASVSRATASASVPADGVVPEVLAAAGPAPAASGSAFVWPSATRVSYLLTGNYRGEVTGQAEVEWIRVGDRYQVHLDLLVGPEFAPIISRRMSSEGRIATSGLAPERYDEETQVMLRDRRRVRIVFEDEAVVLANGQRRVRLPGVQDSASQFIQFTWLFATRPELLRVGNTFEVPLALPRGLDNWIYDVLDEQTLQTPFGPLATFHLKPRRAVRKANELSAEMWFAPELRFLPVRIRIEQDAATFIDLTIAKKPEISAS